MIGSSLAFRISDFFHGTPTVLPGSYALHQNQTFAEVRALLAAGPNIYPVDVRPGLTLSEVAAQVDSLPGHAPGELREGGAERGRCTRSSRRRAPTTSRACSAPGSTWSCPGRATPRSCADMVQRFDRDATARRPEHGLGGARSA